MRVLEYVGRDGKSPFREWFDDLDAVAAARVATALVRLEKGNVANLKSAGEGVLEARIHFGPGYRVYLGRDGERIVILLGGGTKHGQQRDIAVARERWSDYKRRRRMER